MKLEWLEAVMEVVKFGSFSEAAEVIPCSQSTVSRYVKSAEGELGVTIFKRSSNSNVVKLTPDGEMILPAIEKLIRDYGDLRDRIGMLSIQNRQTPLAIGLDPRTFSSFSKGNLVSLLYMRYPEIFLTIEEINPFTYMEQLVMGKVDAILFLCAIWEGEQEKIMTNDSTLHCVWLGTQRLSVAFGEKHAPGNRDSITFEELRNERFIFHSDIRKTFDPSDRKSRHSMFLHACLNSGFEPEIVTVGSHLADIKPQLAMQGKGVFPSTIPAFLREYSGLRYATVTDAPYYVEYYLLSLEGNRQSGVDKFVDFMRECFAEPRG